jgi:hypothetical protein
VEKEIQEKEFKKEVATAKLKYEQDIFILKKIGSLPQ